MRNRAFNKRTPFGTIAYLQTPVGGQLLSLSCPTVQFLSHDVPPPASLHLPTTTFCGIAPQPYTTAQLHQRGYGGKFGGTTGIGAPHHQNPPRLRGHLRLIGPRHPVTNKASIYSLIDQTYYQADAFIIQRSVLIPELLTSSPWHSSYVVHS